MTRVDIRDWVIRSFKPIGLATPFETLDQIIDSCIVYWNTHSAYKTIRRYDAVEMSVTDAVQVDVDIKTIVKCYPLQMKEVLFQNHPMWVLLGFITLDRYTQDLMQLGHTFDGYKIYLGNDFRWRWERPEDESLGGWIYLQQVPQGSSHVCVVGTKKVIAGEDIKDEFIYGWIREYVRSTVKVYEGSILRKGGIIGIANDGGDMVAEGKEERKELEEKLRQESRWLLLASRK